MINRIVAAEEKIKATANSKAINANAAHCFRVTTVWADNSGVRRARQKIASSRSA